MPTEVLTQQDLVDFFSRYTTAFPAVPIEHQKQLGNLPPHRPNPTNDGVYEDAKTASILLKSVPPDRSWATRGFPVTFYLAVLHYALDAAKEYRDHHESVTVDEWYHISDTYINDGYDCALLWFYPLADIGGVVAPRGAQVLGGGHGLRTKPPTRARVEAWSRAAMDAQVRRWVAAEVVGEKSPGPFITHVRLPFVKDLSAKQPGALEEILWEAPGGILRAFTLQVHRRGWMWYYDANRAVVPRVPFGSSIG